MQTQITIRGFVVGPIWWPVGAECFKSFAYDVTREDSRHDGGLTLREHVLQITQKEGGDFQHCALAAAELTISVEHNAPGRRKVRSRSWPLDRFPSIADCLHSDPDWCPDYGEE